MESNNAVHQIRDRVLISLELNPSAEDELAGSQTVQPDVGAIDDGFHQPLIDGVIDFLPKRKDERISDPVEHTADRNESILRISNGGIHARAVAPGFPSTDEVNGRDNTLTVKLGRLICSEVHSSSVLSNSGVGL